MMLPSSISSAFLPCDHPEAGAASGTKPRPRLTTRQITENDFKGVAKLLHEGFPRRSLAYFQNVLSVLNQRPRFTNMPACGFMLEADGQPVGALLSIAARIAEFHDALPRLNVSCWYVRPEYRVYGHALAARLGTQFCSSILNTSPASYTLRTIEAQGFSRFANGMFAGIPLLALHSHSAKIASLDTLNGKPDGITDLEWRVLRDHQKFGCTSCVCTDEVGAYPFVFRRRRVKWLPFDGAQLIYCRDVATLSQFALRLGMLLASQGMLWMLVSGNGRLAGIPGLYVADRSPMYFKGGSAAQPGDLAYSENAIFGS